MSAGAYGFSMSTNYNSRPRVAEVLVRDDQMFVIRQREDYEDLMRGEEIPEFLTLNQAVKGKCSYQEPCHISQALAFEFD